MKSSSVVLAAALLAAIPTLVHAQAPGFVVQQVQVPVERARVVGSGNVLVRYILIDPGNAVPVRDGFAPLDRVAVLVLFIGGDGTLGFTANQTNTGSPNFVTRNRNHFAAEGFVVAVVDAANDFNNLATGLRGRRLGEEHRADLQAVMSDLRARYPGLPVWAVGHSRGTVSAAVMGASVTPPADGLVLTSSLTGPDPAEDLNGVALESISAPALIVSHKDEQCFLTQPEDSKALRHRFTASETVHFALFSGGSTPISNPCDPLSPHGFFGIDQKVVEAIARWIKHREEP
jgi:dienelactone hydrolase